MMVMVVFLTHPSTILQVFCPFPKIFQSPADAPFSKYLGLRVDQKCEKVNNRSIKLKFHIITFNSIKPNLTKMSIKSSIRIS